MTLRATVSQTALLAVLGILAALPSEPVRADHKKQLVNVDKQGVILDGHDPVAFFTDRKPVKGKNALQSTYNGATYLFASAEHKAMFDADPAKYEPQFGAFCAYAVSVGRTAPIDVNTYSIVEGRLVVQHNSRASGLWEKDPVGNLKRADKYWPAVVANDGKQIKVDD